MLQPFERLGLNLVDPQSMAEPLEDPQTLPMPQPHPLLNPNLHPATLQYAQLHSQPFTGPLNNSVIIVTKFKRNLPIFPIHQKLRKEAKTPSFPTYHTVFWAVNEVKLAKMAKERLRKLALLLYNGIFLEGFKERSDHEKHNKGEGKGRKDSASLKTFETP